MWFQLLTLQCRKHLVLLYPRKYFSVTQNVVCKLSSLGKLIPQGKKMENKALTKDLKLKTNKKVLDHKRFETALNGTL